MKLVLLGDTHDDWVAAKAAIAVADKLGCNCVSLGDLGDKQTYDATLAQHDNFYLVAGNHERYNVINRYKNYLGNCGTLPFAPNVFFVRGAHSRDKDLRTPFFDWFPEEELSYKETDQALELYEQLRPEIVLSHECPYYVSHKMHGDHEHSHTASMLTEMFKIHQPSSWYFGHHHRPFTWQYGRTFFRCLTINEVVTINV